MTVHSLADARAARARADLHAEMTDAEKLDALDRIADMVASLRTLEKIRDTAEGTLFIDAEPVLSRLGQVYAVLADATQAAMDRYELDKRRTP